MSRRNRSLAATHLERGVEGEEIAVRTLKKSRYKILERNYRTPIGEIDIIARDRKCLVFVEVRTRSSTEFGLPQETVVAKKQKKLCGAAKWYLQKNRLDEAECRFDVVAIVVNDGERVPQAEVIKNAFRPENK